MYVSLKRHSAGISDEGAEWLRQTPFTKTLYHQNAFEAVISR